MHRQIRISLAVAMALLFLSACHAYRILPGKEAAIIESRYPGGDETPATVTFFRADLGSGDAEKRSRLKKAPPVELPDEPVVEDVGPGVTAVAPPDESGIGVADEPGATTVPTTRRLRILSYNIHHGEGVDGKLDLVRIADLIRDFEPDLVALQEVDRGTERTLRVDQPAELAKLTGMEVVFEQNIPYQGGEYGNAVLSRLEIVSRVNHALPQMRPGEQRGALDLELRWPPRPSEKSAETEPETLRFLATHFDYRKDDAERRASAELVNEIAARRPSLPSLLVGDLNARPDTTTLDILRRQWTDPGAAGVNLSFPAEKPDRRIDYILCRPAERWKMITHTVIDERVASDHRPLLCVLELLPAVK